MHITSHAPLQPHQPFLFYSQVLHRGHILTHLVGGPIAGKSTLLLNPLPRPTPSLDRKPSPTPLLPQRSPLLTSSLFHIAPHSTSHLSPPHLRPPQVLHWGNVLTHLDSVPIADNDTFLFSPLLPPPLTTPLLPHLLPFTLPHLQVLQRGDVLTHLDGVPIADDGTFLFREAVRIDFRHLASCAFDGDAVTVGCPRGF